MNNINVHKSLKIFLLALASFALVSCVEEIETESFSYEKLLVVDANISNITKAHQVRLFYTSPVDQESQSESTALSGASVWVESEDGDVVNFTERNAGTYESPNDYGGTLGKSYALFIVTNEGKRYQSTFEQLEEAPEISRIYNRLGVEEADLATDPVPGVQFFIDVDDASNGSQFYRYEWNDAHQIIVPYIKRYDYQRNSSPSIVPYNKDVRECYREQNSSQLILATSTISNGQIKELDINFAPASLFDLTTAYSLEIVQRAITPEAYSYYRKIELFNESNGSLFDKQQGAVIGNMVSIDNPNEKVLGYFEVSGATSKRIFIDPLDFDPEVVPYLDRTCEKYWSIQFEGSVPDFYEATDVAEEMRGSEIAIRGLYELYDYVEGTGEKLFAHKLCVNCTRSGGLEKPDYWQ